ncbi:hypothetical protein [Ruegeria sp. HKCCD8929]|uniref:hypothetical protein n=1 Tax=Ruegeria sp. HKCCD8929 TaxID=2683006 RepID=UPI001489C4E3|nr:hypothetical protein [Ruegeria sp. HKCCD8929]
MRGVEVFLRVTAFIAASTGVLMAVIAFFTAGEGRSYPEQLGFYFWPWAYLVLIGGQVVVAWLLLDLRRPFGSRTEGSR